MTEPIRPSVWRRARRNMALRFTTIIIARDEYQGWPPGLVRGSARYASMTSSVNQIAGLAQAGVIPTPVHRLVLLLGNVVAAVLVQLEKLSKPLEVCAQMKT